ncbi:HupE/UreJ family protein [Pseudomonadales bacterium]|nr:HupE/UreJ family protein [Pseudomonadales bacterium]
MLLIVLFLPKEAEAHRFAPSLLKFVQTAENNYNVVWKTPTEATSNIPLRPTWPDSCLVKSEKPVTREGTGTVSSWTLDCSQLGSKGLVGQRLGVKGLAENQASAMVMLRLMDGRSYQSVVNAEALEFLIPAQPGQSKVMAEYSVLGAEHIWEGPDHLMFVFGLLLLVGGGARLLWTVTAFTVGHSMTLTLVTLGLLIYPVALIEFAIAVSIFALALALTRKDNGGLFKRHPWWLAGGFGLLHGMGFAGALAEIGLPQGHVPLALLFFNVGIEIGQIAFVVLVLALWWSINRPIVLQRIAVQKLLPIPVYLLGGLSAMWCIERGLEVLS